MNTQSYNLLKEAILNKKNITAVYNGYKRIVTPHVIGHKNNSEKCLLYQFDGKSSSSNIFPDNSPNNWRCVFVEKLNNVSIFDGELHTCTSHSKRQTCVDRVDVEISF